MEGFSHTCLVCRYRQLLRVCMDEMMIMKVCGEVISLAKKKVMRGQSNDTAWLSRFENSMKYVHILSPRYTPGQLLDVKLSL